MTFTEQAISPSSMPASITHENSGKKALESGKRASFSRLRDPSQEKPPSSPSWKPNSLSSHILAVSRTACRGSRSCYKGVLAGPDRNRRSTIHACFFDAAQYGPVQQLAIVARRACVGG